MNPVPINNQNITTPILQRKAETPKKEKVSEIVASVITNISDLMGHLDEMHTELSIEKKEERQFAAQIDRLKEKLNTGEIPARRFVIQKNFPLLAELIQKDLERIKEIDPIIKEAAVKQQLRRSTLFQPSKGEEYVYQKLKLPLEEVDPLKVAKSLSSKVAPVLLESSPFFEEGDDVFISKVRKHLKKYATEERINQMSQRDPSGRTQNARNRIEHIRDLIILYDHLNSMMLRKRIVVANTLSRSLPEMTNCDKKQLKRFMKQELFNEVSSHAQTLMDKFFETYKHVIDEAIEGTDTFACYHKKLDNIRKLYKSMEDDTFGDLLENETKKSLPETIKWYDKWKHHIKKPFSQGYEDEHETLGKGVCFAMSLRLIALELTSPNISHDEMAEQVSVTPQDRFFQALYHGVHNSGLNDKVLSRVGLKNLQKIEEILELEDRNLLLEKLSDKLKDAGTWKKHNGVTSISISSIEYTHNDDSKKMISSHAIYSRIDAERQIYRFFDPNYGLMYFDNVEQLTECLQDLIARAYPETVYVAMTAFESVI